MYDPSTSHLLKTEDVNRKTTEGPSEKKTIKKAMNLSKT